METLELFYPRITAQAGGYTFQQGIEIEVSSARASRMDWAKIRFTDRFKPEITLSRLEPAAILLGYGGAFDEVFTGYVVKPYSTGSSANEIVLKDAMMLLEGLTVNETFGHHAPGGDPVHPGTGGPDGAESDVHGLSGTEASLHPKAERRTGAGCRGGRPGHPGPLLLFRRGLFLGRRGLSAVCSRQGEIS